jgi:hypothetical protein
MSVQVFRACVMTAVAVIALAGCASGSDTVPADSGTDAASQTLPARWWNWAAAAPKASDPISDTTGKWCGQNQPTDVWFLAGTFGDGAVSRTCAVPTGTPVYFPVLNQFCEPGSGQSAADALADCRISADLAEVLLDGKPVTAKDATSEGTFRLKPSKDSALTGPDPIDVVAAGLWAGPLTLDPGRHTLSIHGKSGNFEVEATYQLTVS